MALPVDHRYKRAPEVTPVPTVPAFVTPDYDQFPFPHDYKKPHFREAHFTDNDNAITLTMMLPVRYLHDALYFILGHATEAPSGSQLTISRRLPIRIPMDATSDYSHWGMVARAIKAIRVYGDTGEAGALAPTGYKNFTEASSNLHQTEPLTTPKEGLIDLDDPLSRNYNAEIDIEFAHMPYRILSDSYAETDPLLERSRYMVSTFIGGNEYAAMPNGIIYWGQDAPAQFRGQAVSGGGGKLIPSGGLNVKWFKVPRMIVSRLVDTWIFLCNSTVNDTAISFYIYDEIITFDPETLLFIPPQSSPEPKFFPTGHIYYDLDYTFLYRENTWNKLLHPNGSYYTVTLKNTAPLYDTADLELLFG